MSIIISKGSLEGIYPGLIMANGARAEGIEANLFFTFFGLDAIHRSASTTSRWRRSAIPGMHMASLLGVLPGMSAIVTHMMEKKMEKLDIPAIPEFVEMISDTGVRHVRLQGVGGPVRLAARTTSSTRSDIITVGEFYEMAAGGEIIFT